MTMRSLQDERHYRKQSIRIDELSHSVKHRYLFELRDFLVQGSIAVSAREQLVLEVGEHLDHLLVELRKQVDLLSRNEQCLVTWLYNQICLRMGTPEEIAASAAEQKNKPLRTVTMLLFVVHIGIFFLGLLAGWITSQTNYLFVEQLWTLLSEAKYILLSVYALNWLCIGYWLGTKYGYQGLPVVFKSFILLLIPNFMLMLAVLYHWPMYHWFEALLTPFFVMACCILTLSFYPLARFGYQKGIHNI